MKPEKIAKHVVLGLISVIIYVPCIVWITNGIVLAPADKILICTMGIAFLGMSQAIASDID